MIPIEIFEYKQRWQRAGGYAVRLHSDLRSQGKDYCKIQLMKQQWDFSQYTDNYEDTFHFEYKQDADSFRNKFKKYADM
jgi:hypothetical protein